MNSKTGNMIYIITLYPSKKREILGMNKIKYGLIFTAIDQ